MAVAWHEDRKYIQKADLIVLVLLQFGDDERHHWFVFHLGAPLVHRCNPPPSSAPIAGPIGREESSFSQRSSGERSGPPLLVGGVVLHYRGATIMATVGGEDGTRARPWLQQSSASVAEKGRDVGVESTAPLHLCM